MDHRVPREADRDRVVARARMSGDTSRAFDEENVVSDSLGENGERDE